MGVLPTESTEAVDGRRSPISKTELSGLDRRLTCGELGESDRLLNRGEFIPFPLGAESGRRGFPAIKFGREGVTVENPVGVLLTRWAVAGRVWNIVGGWWWSSVGSLGGMEVRRGEVGG